MKAAAFGHEFRFHAGPSVSSLKCFFHVINHISDEESNYHLNKEKNDYYNWVLHSLNEYFLAQKIKSCKTKHQVICEIKKFLRQ